MLPKQEFYTLRLNRPDDSQWEVFVNPYTGVIMAIASEKLLYLTVFWIYTMPSWLATQVWPSSVLLPFCW